MEHPLQTAFCLSDVEILTFCVTVVLSCAIMHFLGQRFYFSAGGLLF